MIKVDCSLTYERIKNKTITWFLNQGLFMKKFFVIFVVIRMFFRFFE